MLYEIEEIKKRRKKLGITQKELAELVGVSQPMIARIESGSIDPKLSIVRKIFDVFDEIGGRKTTVYDVMSSPVIGVDRRDNLEKAVTLMEKNNISQLPVFDGARIVGSISESNILRLIVEKGFSECLSIKVEDVMSEPFPVVVPSTTLDRASRMLMENQALLVMENDRVLGIATKYDIMRALNRRI